MSPDLGVGSLIIPVLPQNLPSYFSTRNHSFGFFLIFQIGVRTSQTDFFLSVYPIRVFIDFWSSSRRLSGFGGVWLKIWSDRRFFGVKSRIRVLCAYFSERINSTVLFSLLWDLDWGIWIESLKCVIWSVKGISMWMFVGFDCALLMFN